MRGFELCVSCACVCARRKKTPTDKLLEYLHEHKESFLESLRNETYRPLPVKRVEIPQPDGDVRLLGIPAMIDRMIQQAISQVLIPIFEKEFSETSYGFVPDEAPIRQSGKHRNTTIKVIGV